VDLSNASRFNQPLCYSGILKCNPYHTVARILAVLNDYYGSNLPKLTMKAPNIDPITTPPTSYNYEPLQLSLLLLSAEDGREMLVDLTRTLAAMAQRGKVSPIDITVELIDTEMMESVMKEPDLLVLFGPRVELKGYPPWHLRLTEIL
jgi:dehydrodolichyl diphosphate syntase complex subunit NUS1